MKEKGIGGLRKRRIREKRTWNKLYRINEQWLLRGLAYDKSTAAEGSIIYKNKSD